MPINPPRKVRLAAYLLTALGTPLVAYLNAVGILGALEVTLWSAEVAVVMGLAGLNTTSSNETTLAVSAPADVEVAVTEAVTGDSETDTEAVEYDGHGAPISDH